MAGTLLRIRSAHLVDLDQIVYQEHLLNQEAKLFDGAVRPLAPLSNDGMAIAAGKLQNPNFHTVLAETPRRVVGFCRGLILPEDYARPLKTAFIESLFVSENMRQQGIGTRLLSAFGVWAKEQKARKLQVSYYAGNTIAQSLYI